MRVYTENFKEPQKIQLCRAMKYKECKAEEVLFNKGDPSDKFYVIIFGEVCIINIDEEDNEIVINTLGEGRSFGERGLVLKEPRSLGVRCKSDVGFICVD